MNKGSIKDLITNISSIKPINSFSYENQYKRSYYQIDSNTRDNNVNQKHQSNQVKERGKEKKNFKSLLSQLKQEIGDKNDDDSRRESNRESDSLLKKNNNKGRNKDEFPLINRQKYISTEPVNLLGSICSEKSIKEKKKEGFQSKKQQLNTLDRNTLYKEISNEKKYIFDDIEQKHYTYFQSVTSNTFNNRISNNPNKSTNNHQLNKNVNQKIAEMTSKIFSERDSNKCSNNIIKGNPSKNSNKKTVIKQLNIIDDFHKETKDYISIIKNTKESNSFNEPLSVRNDDDKNNNMVNILNNINIKTISKNTIQNKEGNNNIIRKSTNRSLLVAMNEQIIQMNFEKDKIEKSLKQKEYTISLLKNEISDIKNQKEKDNASYLQKIQIKNETIVKMEKQKEKTDSLIKKCFELINNIKGEDKINDICINELNKLLKEYYDDTKINICKPE